jgi:predicted O-linked N-acetylglucosamine transferase (SPINDLY family)
MGAGFMDYIIGDPVLIPESARKYYSEKIAYLPNCYQANDRTKTISDRQFTRQELGLPNEGFVFCCFNNSYKITPTVFDSWMKILQGVPGSVLWLIEGGQILEEHLRQEASARGVDPTRLIFASRLPMPEYLARYRIADLFLDTTPFNAGTTASDALWAGLPVLTMVGETFAARMAASLLSAIELPDLITNGFEEYEALAIELGMNGQKMIKIRDRLSSNRLTKPLFNTPLFTRHLEAAYKQMYEKSANGLPPADLWVEGNMI